MKNNLLNPYVRGLADGGANDALHINAERMRTPSVEPDVGMFLEFFLRGGVQSQRLYWSWAAA